MRIALYLLAGLGVYLFADPTGWYEHAVLLGGCVFYLAMIDGFPTGNGAADELRSLGLG